MRPERATPTIFDRPARCLPMVLLALLLLGLGLSSAAQTPGDAVFSGFVPDGEFLFELEGETPTDTEIFYSQRAQAYLIMAPALRAPLILEQRGRQVSSVSFMKVARRDNGTVDVLADADLVPQGQLTLEGMAVSFPVGEKKGSFRPKPPLLGHQDGNGMRTYDVGYDHKAAGYTPDNATIEALRGETGEVKVMVFFGSWCPVCKRSVPSLLRIEEELSASDVSFAYYGLPKPPEMADDPEAKRLDIKGVPTAIVFVGDKEIGRLDRADWQAPEKAIKRLLNGA